MTARVASFTFADDRHQARLEECRREAQADGLPPLLTLAEAATYLRYQGPNAANSAYCLFRKHGVVLRKRGKYALVRSCDVVYLLKYRSADVVTRARQACG